MTIWCMRIAFWIPKATNTHSEFVIFIGYVRQQWFRESASMSGYAYIACLVIAFSLDIRSFNSNINNRRYWFEHPLLEPIQFQYLEVPHIVNLLGRITYLLFSYVWYHVPVIHRFSSLQ